jgi:hypothetical protein
MDEHLSVTVSVPAQRLAEFHQMFGRWLSDSFGAPVPGNGIGLQRWENAQVDLADAFYRAVSRRAKMILDCWMDATGPVDADATARAAGLDGPYGVAGCLSSVGKASARLKVELPFEHFPGDGDTPTTYRMLPTALSLFRSARAKAGTS